MSGSAEPATASEVPTRSVVRRAAPAALAALAASVLTGALVTWVGPERAARSSPPVSRFKVMPPSGETLGASDFARVIAISPDGRYFVSVDPPRPLAVRAIDGLDFRRLSGTDGANQPFFSADSQWIGFFQNGALRRVPASGGVPITICQTGMIRGAAWSDDGSIVFATLSGELMRLPAGGCEPTVLVKFDPSAGQTRHWFPSVLPGGRGILFTVMPPNRADAAQVAVLDLKTGQQRTLIDGSQAEYVETGYLVYAAANTLRAVRFDLERLAVVGDPVTVVDQLAVSANGAAQYAVSRTGTLVYFEPGPQARSLVWVDRKGQESAIPFRRARTSNPVCRPTTLASPSPSPIRSTTSGCGICKRGGPLTRLTSDPSPDGHPIWTADGQRLVFASLRSGAYNLYTQAADGTGIVERLTAGPDRHIPAFVLPDGTGIIGTEIATQGDIVWFRRMGQAAPDASPGSNPWRVEPLIKTRPSNWSLTCRRTGATLPTRWRLKFLFGRSRESKTGGGRCRPMAGRDRDGRNGRELFYLDEANRLTAVQVQTSNRAFVHGSPTTVVETTYAGPFENAHPYDLSADGQRFLMIKQDATAAAAQTGVTVVLNWFKN